MANIDILKNENISTTMDEALKNLNNSQPEEIDHEMANSEIV